MIDLHSHILPGVDDGARDISESIEMAKLALQEGIHIIVATPHHLNNQYENPRTLIIEKVKLLNKALTEEKVDLKVVPGQEVRIYGEMVQGYEAGEIMPIAHTQYLLVEFPSNHVPRYTSKLFFDLQLKGLVPVIVHPERNKEIIESPEILYEFVKNGAITQITAASISGHFGKKVKNFSMQLIESNLAHFIASDAHNTRNRTFKMIEAMDIIQAKYGTDLVYMMEDNAELVLQDRHIFKEVPEPIKKKKFFFNIF